MTGARHGWRKNSKDTDVVCIGQKTHQVLHNVHVLTDDEPSPQKHDFMVPGYFFNIVTTLAINSKGA